MTRNGATVPVSNNREPTSVRVRAWITFGLALTGAGLGVMSFIENRGAAAGSSRRWRRLGVCNLPKRRGYVRPEGLGAGEL